MEQPGNPLPADLPEEVPQVEFEKQALGDVRRGIRDRRTSRAESVGGLRNGHFRENLRVNPALHGP